jgi:5'-3' exonuclease
LVDLDWIQKKYQIPGDRYGLFAMIRGDSSDGLPGIRGIGEKGAANIANLFATLPEVVLAAQNDDQRMSTNTKKKILQAMDYTKIAPKLVGCALNVPIPQMNISLPSKPQSMKKIRELQKEFGLGASIDRIISAFGWSI